MNFRIDGQPPRVTAQEKGVTIGRNRKPIFYDKPEVRAAKTWYLYNLYQHKPEEPIEGAVYLKTEWTFLTHQTKMDGQYKTTKPDTENLLKMFKDCMTKTGFWIDDAQVVYEVTVKKWGKRPGIEVSVLPIGEGVNE